MLEQIWKKNKKQYQRWQFKKQLSEKKNHQEDVYLFPPPERDELHCTGGC